MNRKMLFWMSLVIALVTCSATSAWADTLAFDSMTAIPTPFGSTTPYDITAIGNLDWELPGVDEKSGGTVIPWIHGQSAYAEGPGDYPAFAYTNGTTSGSATVSSKYAYTTPYTMLALPAGSGQITVWLGDGGPAPYGESSCNVWFDGDYPASLVTHTIPNNSRQMMVFDYQTASPRTVWVSSDAGAGAWNVGWFGVAVSGVPEPSTVTLLGIGLTGLLAYAWRKRC